MNTISIQSPITGEKLLERTYASSRDIQKALELSSLAQRDWSQTPLNQRITNVQQMLEALKSMDREACLEVTQSMGRPVSQVPGEFAGMLERAEYMIKAAPLVLADDQCDIEPWCSSSNPHVQRTIAKAPLGTVLIIAPWNYPYLTVINALVPALLAGNCVILKHAPQTLLCAERIEAAFKASHFPQGVFQHVLMAPEDTALLIEKGHVQGVSFTGSVEVGTKVQQLAAKSLIPTNLELGGKDGAWVMHDADIAFSAKQLASGAFYNSGQSCCAIERIFVDNAVYAEFLDAFCEQAAKIVTGDPMDSSTTMGPVANTQIMQRVAAHMDQASQLGANVQTFGQKPDKGYYCLPQIASDATTKMLLMQEESFGPCVGIMSVETPAQAIDALNNTPYGLTASLWTQNLEHHHYLASLNVGTAFMNQCDYLDPALPWMGRKHSGLGTSLSRYGFDAFIQRQSRYIRKVV